MTPFWLQVLQCLALYFMLLAVNAFLKKRLGPPRRGCDECYESGRTAGAEDQAERIAELEAELKGRVELNADLMAEAAKLEAELKARIETGDELSAELARTLAERENYRSQADKLGGMNERIERRLTAEVNDRAKVINDLQGMLADSLGITRDGLLYELAMGRITPDFFASKRDRVEQRVRDGYSKGYALGQADAFERVRQVFPIDAA